MHFLCILLVRALRGSAPGKLQLSMGGGESGGASVETMETSQQRSLLSAHRDFFLCYLAYQDILVLFGCS